MTDLAGMSNEMDNQFQLIFNDRPSSSIIMQPNEIKFNEMYISKEPQNFNIFFTNKGVSIKEKILS